MYFSVTFSKFAVVQPSHSPILEHFRHPEKIPCTHLQPSPNLSQHSAFCLSRFAFSGHFRYKESDRMWSSAASLSYSDSIGTLFLSVAELHSFVWIDHSLSIHWVMSIWVVSSLGLL